MSLIKDLLLEKKLITVSEEIDAFMDANEIGLGTLLQRIEFDKSVFDNIDQVTDFLKAHYLDHMLTDEESGIFTAMLYDEFGFITESLKKVEIREGIVIVVGQLRDATVEEHMGFKLSSENIKFSGNLPSIIELATVIKGFHASYGKVELTKDNLKSFKENFEKNSYGVDVSIDFDHETREAAGWVKEVYLSDDGLKLYGVVKWTPKGALSLNDREFRYFSPEFTLNFVHPHSGKAHGPTLMGGALVNRPFLKMDAIVELKDKQKIKGESQMETISLSDHNSKVLGLEKNISDLKLSESTLKAEKEKVELDQVKLSEELISLKAQMVKKESDEKHQKLFTEGKINKAQLTALEEGKDLFDVLSLSEKMNTEPKGTNTPSKQVKLSDAEVKMCEKLGLTTEEYIQANKGEI